MSQFGENWYLTIESSHLWTWYPWLHEISLSNILQVFTLTSCSAPPPNQTISQSIWKIFLCGSQNVLCTSFKTLCTSFERQSGVALALDFIGNMSLFVPRKKGVNHLEVIRWNILKLAWPDADLELLCPCQFCYIGTDTLCFLWPGPVSLPVFSITFLSWSECTGCQLSLLDDQALPPN